MTAEQLLSDTVELTNYLCQCFGQTARSYLEQLEAPVKGFYTFDRSAHSPLCVEPERTCRILRDDVLTGATRFADSL